MKVLVVAGGTGGHFYPGLSVAKALIQKGHNVEFFIRSRDYVSPLLERENIPFKTIAAAGFNRKWDPRNVLSLVKLSWGVLWSFIYLLLDRPDVLFALGGYLSFPPVVTARVLGIPVILHEQNVKPGLANQFLSRFAKYVAISFEPSRSFFPKDKTVLTGIPIRPEFNDLPSLDLARKKMGLDKDKKTILIFGGSQGAHHINELVVEACQSLPHIENFQVLHYTGDKDKDWVTESYRKINLSHNVEAYCHDMPTAYAASDLVICRSGASTVAEIMAAQKQAVLIPYPFATENHQLANAKILEELGLADVFEQKDLTAGQLVATLENRLNKTKDILFSDNYKNDSVQKIMQLIEKEA